MSGLEQSVYIVDSYCSLYDNGYLLTRPLKFSSLDLRTIRDVITYGLFPADEIQSVLYGSPDNRNFIPVASSVSNEIHRISGTPYKAHRLLIRVINGSHDFSISHAAFNVFNRYTNKLR